MKKFIYFLFGALAVFMTACSEDPIAPLKPDASLASRATTPHMQSETNPTLLTDWENCDVINLSLLGNNGLPIQVTSPWKQGASSALSYDFSHDIKKEDGWVMLFHTFCKPNLDPGLTYLCFYNRFTGYLKIMYYSNNQQDEGTHTSWRIASNSTTGTLYPFFSDYEYFSNPIEGSGICNVSSIMVENATEEHSGVTKGWNGFQMRVGDYIPNVTYPSFNLKAYNSVYTDYTFFGKTEETTKGTISTLNTSSKDIFESSLAKASLKIVGDKAKDVVDSFAKSHLNKNFLGINFGSIVTNIASSNYVGAIASGLSAVFKLFVHDKPTYSVSDVSLKTEGTVNIEGNSETHKLSTVEPLTFDLNDILSINKTLSDIKELPDTTKLGSLVAAIGKEYSFTTELGVWNLKKKPTIYYQRYSRYYNLIPDPIYSDAGLIDFNGEFEYPSTTVGNVEVVFNPTIKPYVKSYYVTTNMIDVTGGNRSLNISGFNLIRYNPSNLLSKQGDVSIYGINPYKDGLIGSVYSVPGSYVDESTEFYLDWGDKVSGYRAAVITLTMNIEYMGKSQTITESRVYDVDYLPNPNGIQFSQANNPPYSFVVNQKGNYYGFDLSAR